MLVAIRLLFDTLHNLLGKLIVLLGGLVATRFGLTAPYWIGFVVAAAVTAATWRVFDRATMTAAAAA